MTGGARNYLERLVAPLAGRVRLGCPVNALVATGFGVTIWANGHAERFDDVVVAAHSDQALRLLADATSVEQRILSAIPYRPNRVVLHRDKRLMPKRRAAWSAWNCAAAKAAPRQRSASPTG